MQLQHNSVLLASMLKKQAIITMKGRSALTFG